MLCLWLCKQQHIQMTVHSENILLDHNTVFLNSRHVIFQNTKCDIFLTGCSCPIHEFREFVKTISLWATIDMRIWIDLGYDMKDTTQCCLSDQIFKVIVVGVWATFSVFNCNSTLCYDKDPPLSFSFKRSSYSTKSFSLHFCFYNKLSKSNIVYPTFFFF